MKVEQVSQPSLVAGIRRLLNSTVGCRHDTATPRRERVFGMKFNRQSPLARKARRGFRGYPVATVAFYGPDDRRATKVAVGIVAADGAEPSPLERWVSTDSDVRSDPAIGVEILHFIEARGVKSVVMADRIIGCPHEEGTDYPEGQVCPQCPFWAHRDRWSGNVLH